jgi:hypothetical protein
MKISLSGKENPMPNTEQVKKFIDALEDADYTSKPYSGRGMFGKSCVSVSGGGRDDEDNPPVSAWEIAKDLFTERWDGEFDNLPAPQQDSLGLGIVLYWPSYQWPEGD